MDMISQKMARRFIKVGVAALVQELGFKSISNIAMETIIEMSISFLSELGRSTRTYTELTGRTQTMLADVVAAMVGMGFRFDNLKPYGMRGNRPALRAPTYPVHRVVRIQNWLRSGPYFIPPPHVPRFFPPFPAAHTWVKTMTHKEPVTEYDLLRVKDANSKRCMKRALTKYVVNTSNCESLFQKGDINLFPLLKKMDSPKPYLIALLPEDQVFHDEFSLFNVASHVYPLLKERELKSPYIRHAQVPRPGAHHLKLTPKGRMMMYTSS